MEIIDFEVPVFIEEWRNFHTQSTETGDFITFLVHEFHSL
jgi:hypothetical protein